MYRINKLRFSAWLLSASAFLSPSWITSFAAVPSACEGLFSAGQSKPVAQALVDDLFERAETGITDRGFISSKPALTPELASLAHRKGLKWWGLRIYVAETLAAAKAHSAQEPDPLMQGVYLLRQGSKIVEREDLTQRPAPAVFRELTKAQSLYYIKDGQAEKIDPAFIRKNLTIDEMEWSLEDIEHGPYLYQTGWTFSKSRGVIIASETLASSTYKKTRQVARKLIGEGFRITFNKDFKQALDQVASQKRKVLDKWVAKSRYEDPELYNTALESFKNGNSFSVEVWNEKGELVGGIIGDREGSIFSPESTFYDQDRYPQISIGFSKVAVAALVDRLQAAGIPFLDSGMVSHFTASMKGRLIPSREFQRLIQALPEDAKPDLETDWQP